MFEHPRLIYGAHGRTGRLVAEDVTPLDAEEAARAHRYALFARARYPELSGAPDFVFDLDALARTTPGTLSVSAFGCHGTSTAKLERIESVRQLGSVLARRLVGRQGAVAGAVTAWHARQRRAGKQSIGFLLGDNFYESGLAQTEPAYVDTLFDEGFVRMYCEHEGRALGVPWFSLLGNHDYNFHGHAVTPRAGGRFAAAMQRAMAEVDYGYRTEHPWHMPYRYYALSSSVAEFFLIDSTTFLFDPAQRRWLCDAYECLAHTGKWKVLLTHHGPVSLGRRAGRALRPSLRSLPQPPMAAAAALDRDDDVHRHLLEWIVRSGMGFELCVSAHDHLSGAAHLAWYTPTGKARSMYYVLAGGGGAALGSATRPRALVGRHHIERVDLAVARHGFTTLDIDRDRISLNLLLRRGAQFEPAWSVAQVLLRDSAGVRPLKAQ